MIKDSFNEIFNTVEKVLIVLGHPDDMEINCGGTIARLSSENIKVRLVVTTNGGKGTKDKTGITETDFGNQRIEEQKRAGTILGISEEENINLEIPDGEFESSVQNIERIVYHIRDFKPDLVITHNPQMEIVNFSNKSCWVNHRDHRNTAQVTLDAVFPYARNTNFFAQQLEKHGLSVHETKKLLLTDSYMKDTVKFININNFIDLKKKALQQHISAFDPADADDYIEENKYEDGYYEPFGYYQIY